LVSIAVEIEVLDPTPWQLGEGPTWNAETGEIGWVDIVGRSPHLLELASGRRGSLRLPASVGAALPRASGGWLACLEAGPALLGRAGDVEPFGAFAEADGGPPASPVRANDAKCDARGRCFLGTMAWDATPGAATLYRLDPGARVPAPVLSGVTIPNGLGWSPPADTMYYVDSATQCVCAFDYDLETATLTNKRVFASVGAAEGLPDGLAVDADGCVWVALWGGSRIRRFTPDGRPDRDLALPARNTSSCAFAGPELTLLVVTSARDGLTNPGEFDGATFLADVGVSGLPISPFAG
jgi:sugar lactone lactonase YvrE